MGIRRSKDNLCWHYYPQPLWKKFVVNGVAIFSSYCVYKFVDDRLSVGELWTNAKDITMDVGSTLGWAVGGIVGGLNWTLHGAKDITNATWNWTMENKHYAWEYPRDKAIGIVDWFGYTINPDANWSMLMWGVGICVFVWFLYERYAREPRTAASPIIGYDQKLQPT
jgi:hypothetical protein